MHSIECAIPFQSPKRCIYIISATYACLIIDSLFFFSSESDQTTATKYITYELYAIHMNLVSEKYSFIEMRHSIISIHIKRSPDKKKLSICSLFVDKATYAIHSIHS